MKRFALRVFPFLLALASILPTAFAPKEAWAQTKSKEIHFTWRNLRAANPNNGLADSTDAGAPGTAAQHVDTTTAIGLFPFWSIPSLFSTTTANDSIAYLRFTFHPSTTSPTVASDSIYVGTQVSDDGITWITALPTLPHFVLGLDGTLNGILCRENSANDSYNFVIKQQVGNAAGGGSFQTITGAVPGMNQLYGWRYIRFMVQSDLTGRFGGELQGFVTLDDASR